MAHPLKFVRTVPNVTVLYCHYPPELRYIFLVDDAISNSIHENVKAYNTLP